MGIRADIAGITFTANEKTAAADIKTNVDNLRNGILQTALDLENQLIVLKNLCEASNEAVVDTQITALA